MANWNEVIIVGAGPAGLAVSACLKQAGIPSLILEQNDRVASAWHRHYNRLHLHTDKRNSALPFHPFPKEYPRYPSRKQVIDYLETYVEKFQPDIHFNQKVENADHAEGQWKVQTQDSIFQSRNLVIAAGYNCEPVIPTSPGMELFSGTCLHSSEYKSGESFRGKKVLVVGFGNSGGEIAIDLWEHGALPGISVRSPVNVIPRELLRIPILSISILQRRWPAWLADTVNAPILRAVIGDLTRYGLQKLPHGALSQIERHARIPLIDVGTIDLIKRGELAVYPGIERFTTGTVRFADGRECAFDAVVFATGYRPRVDFVQCEAQVLDVNGRPLSSGCESGARGLYFCGYYVSPTGMLREITMEAQNISASIAHTIRLSGR